MAASLRAAATRMLRLGPAVHPGEGLGRIFRTQNKKLSKSTLTLEEQTLLQVQKQREELLSDLFKSAGALKEEDRTSFIQETKEELYDLIASAEANSAASSLDSRLLKVLSTQVKPRPQDPQWRKITQRKKMSNLTAVAGVLVINALAFGGLSGHPEVVEYNGYHVTAESLPLIRGYQHGVRKQDGYQPAPAEGVHKQEEMQKQRG